MLLSVIINKKDFIFCFKISFFITEDFKNISFSFVTLKYHSSNFYENQYFRI